MELVEDLTVLDLDSGAFESEFDTHYGLLAPEQTILVRAYSDDSDDRLLAEIRPKFIVMFEPNMEFIRRIEVGTRRFLILFMSLISRGECRCIRARILALV